MVSTGATKILIRSVWLGVFGVLASTANASDLGCDTSNRVLSSQKARECLRDQYHRKQSSESLLSQRFGESDEDASEASTLATSIDMEFSSRRCGVSQAKKRECLREAYYKQGQVLDRLPASEF